MITVNKKQDCAGCYACAAICPKQCIRMTADEEGFEYPQVDKSRCVDCHLCEGLCGAPSRQEDAMEPRAFAAIALSDALRMASSSGGAFTALATCVLQKSGVVYGAAIGKNAVVEHVRATNLDTLTRLRRSKYVQSRVGDVYRQTKEDLAQDKWVLFTGTPCQIGGLRNFLRATNTEKLVCQDVICHGVPPYSLWKRYLEELGFPGDVEANFRKKTGGWDLDFKMEIRDENHTYTKRLRDDPYGAAFLTDLMLRPSCHHCQYRNRNWRSDITLADFWEVERALPDFADRLGVSMVLVHTEKGAALLEEAAPLMNTRSVDVEDALWGNRQVIAGVNPHPKRDLFLNQVQNTSFRRLALTYARGPLPVRMLRHAKRKLTGMLKKAR